MQMITVSPEMFSETSAFAKDVFIGYYDDLIGHAQAVYMADLFLSEEAIGKLTIDGAVFRLVKDGDETAGFCEYKKEEGRVFLSKLYVSKHHRGQGIGRMMFEDAVNYAKENGLDKIYLTVNKGNMPSYQIYLHLGFKVIDAVVNDIGNGYVMDDYIMEYTISEK